MIRLSLLKNNSWLKDSHYDIEDEERVYREQLKDVYNNTRWYLDNLDYMAEYRVRWNDYRSKTPTLPFRAVKKRNLFKEKLP